MIQYYTAIKDSHVRQAFCSVVVESFEVTGHIDMRKVKGCEKTRICQLDIHLIQNKPYIFAYGSHREGVFVYDPQTFVLMNRLKQYTHNKLINLICVYVSNWMYLKMLQISADMF